MSTYCRLKEAMQKTGLTRYDLMAIFRTPGQTVVHKQRETRTAPYVVNLDELELYMRKKAAHDTARATSRRV